MALERQMKKANVGVGFEVRRIPATAEQRAATKKMLDSPCPYCSDPKKFQKELTGEGREEGGHLVARVGKFWKRDDEPYMLPVRYYNHGGLFPHDLWQRTFHPPL